jgi:flagellar basal-body rod protein FlgC
MTDPTSGSTATMAIAASALKAQQSRMRVIAENVANADSVANTPGGDPYRRQTPIFEPAKVADGVIGVAMTGVRPDLTPFRTEYHPGAPGADAKGMVKMPNIDSLTEMMDMRDAQRAYQANLNVIENQRSMDNNTLGIIKK